MQDHKFHEFLLRFNIISKYFSPINVINYYVEIINFISNNKKLLRFLLVPKTRHDINLKN